MPRIASKPHTTIPLFSAEDIATMRQLAQLSQEELGQCLGYAQQTIADWERAVGVLPAAMYVPFLNCIMARFAYLDGITAIQVQLVALIRLNPSTQAYS